MSAQDPTQNQLQLHQAVPVVFPLKGIVDAWSRETQPPATTPDCLNVTPYDLTLRGRGGTRCGSTNTLGGTAYGAGGTTNTFLQGLLTASGEATSSTFNPPHQFEYTSRRYQALMLFAGGKAYYGTSIASTLTTLTYSGTNNALLRTVPVAATAVAGYIWFAQVGRTGYGMNPATPTSYTDAPAGSPLHNGPRCVCAWRNRLVVAGTSDGSPQNVYFSRAGDATDFNYGYTDAGAAFAMNESTKTGQIGDPVTALIPLNDNQLLVGADHALWLIDGDPAAGGSASVLNDGVGIVGPTAWCMNDTGDVFFVSNNGLCKLHRGSMAVENLSAERYASYFSNLLPAGYYWSLVWDLERHGCWMFRSSTTVGTTNTHLWWDDRTQGLFPVRLPAGFGPTAAGVYDDASAGRTILFGGWAGNSGGTAGAKVYRFDNSVFGSDDGTAIDSYAYLGPHRPFGTLQQVKITSLDVTLGETPAGGGSTTLAATLTLQSGNSATEALSSPRQSGTVALSGAGRQVTFRSRQSATDFFVKLESNAVGKVWSLEEAVARVIPAGRARA